MSGHRVTWVVVLLVSAGLCSCASHQAVVSPPKPAERIRLLAVQPFDGSGGADVTREFVVALKAAGWAVAGKNQNADALLTGSVNDYSTNHKLMVFLGETNTLTNGKAATVSNPIVTGNGSQILPQGPTTSVNNPHLVSERAVVGVSARLVSQRTTLWGDDFSYESLEFASARQAVVFALVRSLSRALPPGGSQ